jgi:hypothetical protein
LNPGHSILEFSSWKFCKKERLAVGWSNSIFWETKIYMVRIAITTILGPPSHPVFNQPYMLILVWVAPPSHGTWIGCKWVLKLKKHTCGCRYWAIQGC